MTTLLALAVSGATPPAPPSLRVLRVSGAGAVPVTAKLRVLRVSGAGTAQPTLTVDRAKYDPGETITVTVTNPILGAAWKVTGVGSYQQPPTDTLCVLTAPATLNGVTVTVQYAGTGFAAAEVTPAFVLVGPTSKPATVWVNVP